MKEGILPYCIDCEKFTPTEVSVEEFNNSLILKEIKAKLPEGTLEGGIRGCDLQKGGAYHTCDKIDKFTPKTTTENRLTK